MSQFDEYAWHELEDHLSPCPLCGCSAAILIDNDYFGVDWLKASCWPRHRSECHTAPEGEMIRDNARHDGYRQAADEWERFVEWKIDELAKITTAG